jgi:hypothetical protein
MDMMTKIANTKELPRDPLRCFAISEVEAQKAATQYGSAWFYPLARSDKGYLYVLNSEWEQKHNEHHSNLQNEIVA